MEFYGRAFGARPGLVMDGPGGVIMHAEIKIGDSILMLADEQPPMGPGPQTHKAPKNLGGTSAGMVLYVKDADAAYAKRGRRRRHRLDAADGHVLGRSLLPGRGSVRPRVGDRDARQGPERQADESGDGGDGAADLTRRRQA